MALAVELARQNVIHQSGGPFGAVVVDSLRNKIVGWGANSVLSSGSIFHAEVCALWDAQYRLGVASLESTPKHQYALVTSAAPCAMCAGAAVWSGVARIATGASTSDVEHLVGFDEGPLPKDIVREFKKRGIAVKRNVLRQECCEVLREYVSRGGAVYGRRRVA